MDHIAHDLFLLMVNLSQIKDRKLIQKLFLDALDSIFSGIQFQFTRAPEKHSYNGKESRSRFEIATAHHFFGLITISSGDAAKVPEEKIALIRNAVKMLAVILENRSRHELLESDRNRITRERDRLFNLSIDMLCVAGFDGYFKQVNPAWTLNLGWTEEDLLSCGWLDYVHPDDLESTIRAGEQLFNGVPLIAFENRYRCKDGLYRWLSWNSFPLTDDKMIFAVCRDVTDQKAAERQRNEQIHFLQELIDRIPNPVYYKDRRLIYQGCNRAFEKYRGLERDRIIGQTDEDLSFDDSAEKIRELDKALLEKGGVQRFESTLTHADGSFRDVIFNKAAFSRIRGDVGGIVGVIIDITETKRLEKQLHQAQKMEAIGTLAGGIAHDFNNILFPIIGYTEMAVEDLTPGTRIRQNLREVLKAADRAKNLIQHILTFSRSGKKEKRPVQLQLIIKEILHLLRASLPTTVEIVRRIDDTCGPVSADSVEIHQMMMNLCTNAYQSMTEGKGRIIVSIEERQVESDLPGLPREVRPGRYAVLSVQDDGSGIPPSVMERIFDPYYTTKEVGKGTGLGLFMVHSIVRGHKGHVVVSSKPGEGSLFTVYLPVIDIRKVVPAETKSHVKVPAGNERVLVVDDEPQIVEMIRLMLEGLGYRVTATVESSEALKHFRDAPDNFDLVITDMTMPGMTGLDLAGEIMAIRPEVPVILCTGFSAVVSAETAEAGGIRAFIMKPIIRKDLAKVIRKVLAEEDPNERIG